MSTISWAPQQRIMKSHCSWNVRWLFKEHEENGTQQEHYEHHQKALPCSALVSFVVWSKRRKSKSKSSLLVTTKDYLLSWKKMLVACCSRMAFSGSPFSHKNDNAFYSFFPAILVPEHQCIEDPFVKAEWKEKLLNQKAKGLACSLCIRLKKAQSP